MDARVSASSLVVECVGDNMASSKLNERSLDGLGRCGAEMNMSLKSSLNVGLDTGSSV